MTCCRAAVHGPEGAAAGTTERHSGVTGAPQSSHQVDPTRPAHPGHHDDHRHHRRRLPALPVLDQTHQRRPTEPLGRAPAAEEPRPQPGGRQVAATFEGGDDSFLLNNIVCL